jgi:prolyl-tRNA synthetase
MYEAYTRIFTRTAHKFRAVRADSGAIGGDVSQEFHVLAASGEDAIVFSDADDYAANLEAAAALPPPEGAPEPREQLRPVQTPGARTIADLAQFLQVEPARCVKTLIVEGREGGVVALVVRGDHELNAVKAQKLPEVASPLRMATAEQVLAATGTEPGYVGVVGLECPVYVDHAALALADFICGANSKDVHLMGVNWQRDVPQARAADLRNVVEGDPSPSGKGHLRIARGIEVGHIFQLGCKYSEPLRARVLDEAGKEVPVLMGCYGIGVTRIVAAAIEQNHDERGIIWPEPIAPFQVVLVPLNLQKSARVREVSDRLYAELTSAGIEVLFDDRDARPGVKFADAELLGIPHRLVVADRGLEAGKLEYRHRRDSESREFPLGEALTFLRAQIAAHAPPAP